MDKGDDIMMRNNYPDVDLDDLLYEDNDGGPSER